MHRLLLSGLACFSAACGASMIPNTDVEDTSENRAVVNFTEEYRKAVEARNVAKLMSLASADYFDDNGTPDAADDVDFKQLRDKLSLWNENLIQARYEIRYRQVQYVQDRVVVDYTYTGSFRVKTPEGERAVRRLDDNRMVLKRTGESFKILSGM